MIKFDLNFCWKTSTYTWQELETDLENRKKAELYNSFQVKLATKNLLELKMHLRRPAGCRMTENNCKSIQTYIWGDQLAAK